MNPIKSNRLAWSVAIAALVLWATSVPSTWGHVAAGAARILDDYTSTSETITPDLEVTESLTATPMTDEFAQEQCVPTPPAVAEVAPATPPATVAPSANEGTFRVCGADAAIERAIEQLVAGRGFSANLTSRGDGCADLTIRATSPAGAGSATTNLSISVGNGKRLSIKIVSEHGATRATLGEQ